MPGGFKVYNQTGALAAKESLAQGTYAEHNRQPKLPSHFPLSQLSQWISYRCGNQSHSVGTEDLWSTSHSGALDKHVVYLPG